MYNSRRLRYLYSRKTEMFYIFTVQILKSPTVYKIYNIILFINNICKYSGI